MSEAVRTEGRRGRAGYSLSELLVVVAILGLGLAISIPLVASAMNQARIRAAADQYAVDLRAARMIAVSKRSNPVVDVTVRPDPINSYSYRNGRGEMRTIQLPTGVRIVSPSSNFTITFKPDGSVQGGAVTTVMRVMLGAGEDEEWRVETSLLGVTRTTRARVAS